MRKLLLITLIAIICLFTPEFQSIANAKMLAPFYYDSNLPSDNLSARYADAILIINVNNYIKLLNIPSDPTFTDSEARKIFDEYIFKNYDNYRLSFTNKALYPLVYIIFYQNEYAGRLSRQISLFTESQKKQYLAILYNIKMSSRLYSAIDKESDAVINGETFADKIAWNMDKSSWNSIKDVINPSLNANVPKNSNTLYDKEQSIQLTPDVVNSLENEARMQYSNILASKNSNSNKDDLFFEWMTKGLEYSKVNKDYTKALDCYTKAINANPSKGEAWSSRGGMKYHLGDCNGAIYDYSQAISIGYNVPENYFDRALSKIILRQYKGASDDFKKVYLLTKGKKSEPLGAMGLVYVNQLQKGKGEFLRKTLINPYYIVDEYIKENGTTSLYNNPLDELSKKTDTQYIPKQFQQKTQPSTPPKLVIPVGCRVYMIFARLKDTHATVKYTTIAKTTDIENMVNSDSRFEWVRYETVPDQEYNNYPHY